MASALIQPLPPVDSLVSTRTASRVNGPRSCCTYPIHRLLTNCWLMS